MLQAQTIMKKDVITITPETPLDKVVDLLIEHNITGVPIVNEDSTVAGMITEKDILRFLLDQDIFDLTNDRLLCETTAYHIMTTNVVSCEPQAPLDEVCRSLVSHNFRRMPVVDKDGKLVGLVSRKDIVAIIT